MTNVNVQFSASIKDLIDATNSVKGAIESVAESAKGASATMQKFGEIAGVGLSVEGIKKFVESEAKLGEQTERIMGQLGISAEQVGVLGGMAKLTGTDLESLTTGFERMSLGVQKSTKDSFNPAAQGLKVLHLNARDLIGLPADEYFRRISEAVSRFNPSLNLTNAIMAVGGRGIAQMISTLQRAGESWDEWQQKIKATGATLSDAQAYAFAKTDIALKLLEMTVQGLGNAMFSQLEPAIDAVVKQMTGFIAEVRDSVKEGGAWSVVLSGLGETLKVIASAFAGVAAMIRFLSVEVKAFWDTTAENGEAVGKQLKADLDKIAKDFKETLTSLYGPLTIEVHPKVKKENAGAMDMGAQDVQHALMAQYQSMIRTADDAFNLTKEKLAEQFKVHEITYDQETKALLTALEKRRSAETEAIDAELLLYARGSAGYEKVLAERKKLDDKYALDHQKIIGNAVVEDQHQWESVLTPVASAFNSQLKGLLDHTLNWQLAMREAFQQLAMDAIKWLEKIAIEQAALGLAKMFGGGPQSMLGGLFGGGAQAAATTENTTALAALQVAIDANTIALGGETAATAAEAAASTGKGVADVAGAGGGIFSGFKTFLGMFGIPTMAKGTDRIVSPGIAFVHANESIVPAARGSGPYTCGADRGGADAPAVHIHMHPVDGDSMQRWLDGGGARIFAKAIGDHWKNNFSSRP